jgi:hypothetical protein
LKDPEYPEGYNEHFPMGSKNVLCGRCGEVFQLKQAAAGEVVSPHICKKQERVVSKPSTRGDDTGDNTHRKRTGPKERRKT